MPVKTPQRRLAKIPAAAEYAAVCHKTIRRRISDGTLTAYRAGRIIRVDLDSVDAWLRPMPTAALTAEDGGHDA